MTTPEKKVGTAELLKGNNNGVLRQGDLNRVAELFGQQPRTTSCSWAEYSRQKDAGVAGPDLHNKCKGNSGQKGIDPSCY